MLTPRPRRARNNQRGMAIIEVIPLMIVFIVILAYSLGSFGVIHTGILNSIAARNYAFETMRNRSNVRYLFEGSGMHFVRAGNRVHAVTNEGTEDTGFYPSERRIAMGLATGDLGRNQLAVHNEQIYGIQAGQQNTTIEVNPVWIMSQYGICLNSNCGGQ